MSRDWTPQELQAVSQAMKAAGYMSYEEFCEAMDSGCFTVSAIPVDLTDDEKPQED